MVRKKRQATMEKPRPLPAGYAEEVGDLLKDPGLEKRLIDLERRQARIEAILRRNGLMPRQGMTAVQHAESIERQKAAR